MNHPQLNLPAIQAQIKDEGSDQLIFDRIRKKYLLLTPEEWVRQHFIHLLIENLGYPAGLFQVERGHQYFGSAKRSDILVFDNTGQPLLLVECKAPKVAINTAALNQISVYNKSINARYVALSNGLKHFVWEFKDGNYTQLKDFPPYIG